MVGEEESAYSRQPAARWGVFFPSPRDQRLKKKACTQPSSSERTVSACAPALDSRARVFLILRGLVLYRRDCPPPPTWLRLRGRCRRGARADRIMRRMGIGRQSTFVAALRHDRMVGAFVMEGAIDTGSPLFEWLKQFLVPTLKRRDTVSYG